MSLPTRACLAMALAWAGGFGLPGPMAVGLPLLLLAIGLGWWMKVGEDEAPGGSRVLEMVALALLLGLLGRALGRVVIATPAALWSLPVVGLGLVIAGRRSSAWFPWLALALTGLALAAAIFGASFEAAGVHAQGRIYSTPILGVHPRQAVAVRIDGFGPHDIVADDYVDPPGGQGYDPERWAAKLEAELHAIAERNYAEGPARARAAYAEARVELREAMVPPFERDFYTSLLSVEVRSGTAGEGSTVEFVCPGQPLDPRARPASGAIGRSCPRKYLVDGSAGLGLASRFAGHTQVIGRDRARLARLLGWPSGDAKHDRRLLALESGAWLLVVALGGWLLGRRRELGELAGPAVGMIGVATVGLLLLALLAPSSEARSALDPHGGPTVLAILLLLIPARRDHEPAALPCALLLAILAAAPLAGRGDALELLAITRDALLDLGLAWSSATALAGSLATVALTIGAAISAAALVDRSRAVRVGDERERRHAGALISLGLVLACGLALALRKPADDLALLQSAAALLVLGVGSPRGAALRFAPGSVSRLRQLVLALVCAAAAAAPILDGDARSPVALGVAGLVALLCLAVGLRPWLRPGQRADPASHS
ncbi:MAG: hypothetical protein R6X02_18455 [Enhygromyxa sp.]